MNDTIYSVDYRFKILYAIGIVLIVAGHAHNGGGSILFEFMPPYMFHVQLFVFCSGYFYKNKAEQKIKSYIKKYFFRLIVPIYIWNFIYAVIVYALSKYGFSFVNTNFSYLHNLFIEPLVSGHQFLLNLAAWFVPPLFFCKISYMLLHKYIFLPRKDITCFLCTLIIGMIGVWMGIHGYNKGLYLLIMHVFIFMPFYGGGAFYKYFLEKYDTFNNFLYFGTLLILSLMILLVYGHPLTYSMAWGNDFNNGLLMPIIVPWIGIAFWLRVSKVLEPMIGKSCFINSIADNTFAIMMHHLLVFFLIKTLFAIVVQNGIMLTPFDWHAYKSNVYYFYLPNNLDQFHIVYVSAGVLLPIWIKKIQDKLVCNMISLLRL